MTARPASTNRRDPAMPVSTEGREAVRSCSTAINDHQKWTCANDAPISRGHCHGISNITRKGFPLSVLKLTQLESPLTSYLARASFARVLLNSRWPAVLPRMADRRAAEPLTAARHTSPVRAFHRSAGAFHSMRVHGSRRSCAHTLGDQHLFQHFADPLHSSCSKKKPHPAMSQHHREGFPNVRKVVGELRNV